VVNRRLNIDYSDSGDNLSIPLGMPDIDQRVRYWGGNYSGASIEHALATIDTMAEVTGSVLLVTHPGGGAESAPVIALVEHGAAKMLSDRSESFFSFAKSHFGLERLSNPSNEVDIGSDIMPLQKNLWAVFGAGNAPSA